MEMPQNFQAEVAPVMGDRFEIKLYWDAVPGADYYKVYRETMMFEVHPPYDTGSFGDSGPKQILCNDTISWFQGQALDIFYWVSAIRIDPLTKLPIESEKSGPLTNIHPFCLRVVEQARCSVADDLKTLNVDGSVYGQVSLYNYKIAAHQALSDINAEPTPSNFTFGSYPRNWHNLLTLGTIYYILPKLMILETAKTMQFNDQGQTWTPPNMADLFSKLLEHYEKAFETRRKAIKQNIRPGPLAVGSLRALYVSPQFLKFRHLDVGRPYF